MRRTAENVRGARFLLWSGPGEMCPMNRRRVFMVAIAVSLFIWAVVLSLVFTGHTKLFWTAGQAVKVVKHTSRTIREKEHRALGDR